MTAKRAHTMGKHLPLSAKTTLEEAMNAGTGSVSLTDAEIAAHRKSLKTGFAGRE